MILGCGGTKEDQHYEKEGKLYGISPFAHCDTDCPYTEGTCFSRCSRLGWNQRPCLKAAYREKKKVRIMGKREGGVIIKGKEDLI